MQAERARDVLSGPRAVRAPARAPRWVVPGLKITLAGVDIILSLASFLMAFQFRQGVSAFGGTVSGGFVWTVQFVPYAALLPFVLIIRLLLLGYYDLYRVRGE